MLGAVTWSRLRIFYLIQRMNPDKKLDELKKKLNEKLSFEEKIQIKDEIIKLEYQFNKKQRPIYQKISCVGCSG